LVEDEKVVASASFLSAPTFAPPQRKRNAMEIDAASGEPADSEVLGALNGAEDLADKMEDDAAERAEKTGEYWPNYDYDRDLNDEAQDRDSERARLALVKQRNVEQRQKDRLATLKRAEFPGADWQSRRQLYPSSSSSSSSSSSASSSYSLPSVPLVVSTFVDEDYHGSHARERKTGVGAQEAVRH